jgi:hypothetical protein
MAIIAAHVAQIQVEAEKAAVAAKVEAEKARMAQSPKITQKTQAVEVLLRQPVLRDDEGAKDFDAWQARPERKVFLLSQFAL